MAKSIGNCEVCGKRDLCNDVKSSNLPITKEKKTKTEKYGMFMAQEIERDENGFVERFVITRASGLFAGAPPTEMRIHTLVPFGNEKFGKQYTAELNRKTDLPFYLTKVKIKVITEHNAVISIDGHNPIKLISDDYVQVQTSKFCVRFVRFQDPGYFYRNLTPHMNRNPALGIST